MHTTRTQLARFGVEMTFKNFAMLLSAGKSLTFEKSALVAAWETALQTIRSVAASPLSSNVAMLHRSSAGSLSMASFRPAVDGVLVFGGGIRPVVSLIE